MSNSDRPIFIIMVLRLNGSGVSLLRMMPENIQSIVFDGFREELSQRKQNDVIRRFLDNIF